MKTPRHIAVILSLLAFLLSGQAGVYGYVWCLGEDGHAALEHAVPEGCGDDAQQDAEGLAASDEHCGPCLDIPHAFDTCSSRLRDRQDLTPQPTLPAALPGIISPRFLRQLAAPLYAEPPARVRQALLCQRTVVLLN